MTSPSVNQSDDLRARKLDAASTHAAQLIRALELAEELSLRDQAFELANLILHARRRARKKAARNA